MLTVSRRTGLRDMATIESRSTVIVRKPRVLTTVIIDRWINLFLRAIIKQTFKHNKESKTQYIKIIVITVDKLRLGSFFTTQKYCENYRVVTIHFLLMLLVI